MLWTTHYLPKLSDIPQNTAPLLAFVTTYSKQKKKGLLLHGPTGTGKTAAVHALAREHNLELIEVNASDFRDAESINLKLGNALKQYSLFSSGKLILVDEVDGISGTKDRGGLPALVDLLKDSTFPVIMTANDPWDKKFSTLRSKCQLVEFPAIEPSLMLPIFSKILFARNISFDESVLKSIARRSGGDLRGALIDLQLLAESGQLNPQGVTTLCERERTESITQGLVRIFKTTDPLIAVSAFDSAGEDLDESILWVDENIPREYKQPADVARAYDALSRADVFRGRIRRWQHWRFLVYVNALITAGVAVAKDAKYASPTKYERTSRILKQWIMKQKYAKRQNISSKLALTTHASVKRTIQHTFPYIKELYVKQHPSSQNITAELELDDDDVTWLVR